MKKLLYLLIAVAGVGFAACSDQDAVVDKIIDDAKKGLYAAQLDYTLTDADYSAISSAANTEAETDADKALAVAVNSTKALNGYATAETFVPARLAALYPALRQGSSVNVTYKYTDGRPEYLSRLAASPTTVFAAENFEGAEYANNDLWNKNGWAQIPTKGGGTKTWQIRTYSNNKYGQVSANGGAAEETEIYVVSPAIKIEKATGNLFTFDVCVGYWNYAGLSVLITEDAKARTTPADVTTWTTVTDNFAIPETPTSGFGTLAPAGSMSLDSYVGKTIYVAFKYNGETGLGNPNRTTTYQIDNVKIVNGDPNFVAPSSSVWIQEGETWAQYDAAKAFSLTPEDYAWLGVTSLSTTTAPNYLPFLLANKINAPQNGKTMAVLYSGGVDEYVYSAATGKWAPVSYVEVRTSQFIFADNGWMFDPTVNYTMVTADYKMVIDYMLANPDMAMFANATDKNEEYYFGFSSRYSNISFRSSYRALGGTYPSNEMSSHDDEYHALDGNDAAQATLLWKRLVEKGFPLFMSLKWPMATAQNQGVDVLYNLTAVIYYPDGVTFQSSGSNYTFTYKVVQDGTAGSPAVFEFVDGDAEVDKWYEKK
ncbi:MAG: choice-of-anchor J domain-containing protein [Alistipes sp.]|jgi:hypothetical protein|nr:choice-of-anchor J domain-containing protein [Alistipes sp.]